MKNSKTTEARKDGKVKGHTLYFRVYFTSGLLKGLVSDVQQVTYPTAEECAAYLKAGRKGFDGKRIVDASFQNFAR